MFDYEEFYKTQPANFLDMPERWGVVAQLCSGKVADIGCCMGILSDYYRGEYVGYDISKSALKMARSVRRKDALFNEKDCTELDGIEIETFDTFVFCEYLEHFKNTEKMLAPIFARAKKGARIVVSVPNGNRVPDPSHERELTIPILRKMFEPFGLVKFYNWSGEQRQIIMTCDIGVPAYDDLALVMVVKNEEKGLEHAVMSAIEHVDRIIIAVDSTSTDKTLEIAKTLADEVKVFEWHDDFARARNEAHAGVKTRWILFLDGHEYIDKWDLRYIDNSEDIDGYMVPIQMEDGMKFGNPRIYKNGVQFEGAVHERQNCQKVCRANGCLIKHDRVGKQSKEAADLRGQQRDDMVPRIMGAQVKENAKNTRALFHLALWCWSKQKYRKGISWGKKYLKYGTVAGERWFVMFNIAMCQMALGNNWRAMRWIYKAQIECPERWETEKLAGLILFQSKNYEEAIGRLIASFNNGPTQAYYKPWQRDDAGTWNAIGECFFRMGELSKAGQAFREAEKACSDKIIQRFFGERAELMENMTGGKKCATIDKPF